MKTGPNQWKLNCVFVINLTDAISLLFATGGHFELQFGDIRTCAAFPIVLQKPAVLFMIKTEKPPLIIQGARNKDSQKKRKTRFLRQKKLHK